MTQGPADLTVVDGPKSMNDRLLTISGVVLCSYALSTVLVIPCRTLGIRFGIMDRPGPRKNHATPVPRTGGLAIFIALISVVLGSLLVLPGLRDTWLASILPDSINALSRYAPITPKLWALFWGSLIVAFVGLADDVLGVGFSPYIKLAGQILAALVLLAAGIHMDLLSQFGPLNLAFSLVWIVGITNSFNLLDNMDGLSSGIALICSLVFLALVMLKGEFFIALLLSAMIGSTLGFYQFNIRGGRIFMGDSGSLLLGFLLGAISVMARYVDPSDASILPVIAPVIILGLPLFDTCSVIVIRIREGRPVFQGDQMHLSHRLVRMGMTSRQAVLFHYLMAFAIASNALLIINSRLVHSSVAVFQVVALVAMVSNLMAAPDGSAVRQSGNGNEKNQDHRK